VACDSIHKAKNDLDVNCRRDGFKDAHATIPSHFNGATAGNILAGGIIGIGIDAATGANDNYPTEYAITMTPDDAAPVPSLPATPPAPADAPPAARAAS